jgi:hypothetical protein
LRQLFLIMRHLVFLESPFTSNSFGGTTKVMQTIHSQATPISAYVSGYTSVDGHISPEFGHIKRNIRTHKAKPSRLAHRRLGFRREARVGGARLDLFSIGSNVTPQPSACVRPQGRRLTSQPRQKRHGGVASAHSLESRQMTIIADISCPYVIEKKISHWKWQKTLDYGYS